VKLERWSTRGPLPADFEAGWCDRMKNVAHAHFALDLAFMRDEARHGRHALAVLVEEGGRRGAIVLREAGSEAVSGWPWRWQAVVENGGGSPSSGLSIDEADWLWARAQELAGGRRLRCYLPVSPLNGVPQFVAGHTYFQTLEPTEDEIWKGLDGAKRRMVKRARTQGFEIVEARDPELMRGFAMLPRDEHHDRPAAPLADDPGPGEGWREWELPWMWLLVAVRNGVVEAGSGFGLYPGATIDYRTNASSPAAKKDGANVMLAWEAIRLGRQRGHRWLNWGGATRFKQEFGGEHVVIHCRLGGGPAWWIPNLIDVSSRRARVRMGAWARKRAKRATARAATRPAASRTSQATLSCWRSHEPLEPGFAAAWKERLARAPRANFGFELDYLVWEARHGRHVIAAMIDEGQRQGLFVLRVGSRGFSCGYPWRWLAAIADPKKVTTPALEAADAAWLYHGAERLCGGRQLRFFMPLPPPEGVSGFEAGATIIQSLERPDDELLASIHPSKRRMIKRAQSEGFHVIEGETLEHYRTFAAIQHETFQRRGIHVEQSLDGLPPPGEMWREWEHPWMWLLLAVRDGRIESGLGDGLGAGGMLEGRTGASTIMARRAGAFALLCYEEARRGRDRGYRWLNHGGDTPFKREMAGTLGSRVVMHCWLGGGRVWSLANRSEAWARGMRRRVPVLWRTFRTKGVDSL
jgi:hypothetical protein